MSPLMVHRQAQDSGRPGNCCWLLAQVPWRSAHTWVVAAALIRGVALAPLASVLTARIGTPVVAPIVVVALAVSAICRDLIASSGLVSISALLDFLSSASSSFSLSLFTSSSSGEGTLVAGHLRLRLPP
jgi:hypothetical protein